jgi:putative acetyltransferase
VILFDIRQDDLEGPEVQALLALHLSHARAATPAGFSFALDLSALKTPQITVWTAWDDAALAAIGALKMLGDGSGEVKSMRTAPDHLRRGAARAIVDHIIGEARRRGLKRLSLETGVGPVYDPAAALYLKCGFADGESFADYQPSPYNRFMHLDL